MEIKFIGITGGSGAGKSSLCNILKNKYPDKIECISLDDYFKPVSDKPRVGNIINHDHPDSLYFDKLVQDLIKLTQGEPVIVNTRNIYLNPEYEKTKKKIPFKFFPRSITLIDGFLVLHDVRIRKLLATSIYLDAQHETRYSRRVHLKTEEYEKKVLIPMHNQFIEPTKRYAKHIIDVSNLTKEQVLEKVEKIIF